MAFDKEKLNQPIKAIDLIETINAVRIIAARLSFLVEKAMDVDSNTYFREQMNYVDEYVDALTEQLNLLGGWTDDD